MTFSCPNHDIECDFCRKLKKKCKLAQPGCVLEGKVVVARRDGRNRSKGKRKR